MERKMPTGIKYIRIINLINIIVLLCAGVFFAAIAVPNFMRAAQAAGKSANPLLLLTVGLVSIAIGWVPAFLLLLLNKGLAQFKRKAKIFQIVLSCLFLFSFPVGTLLYGVALYFLLVDSEIESLFADTESGFSSQ